MKFINAIIVCLILFITIQDGFGQRKRASRTPSKRAEKEAAIDEENKLTYEIKLGNVSISQVISVSAKPAIGYKLSNKFSGGLSTRLFYDYYNYPGNLSDFSIFNYGAAVYARGKVSNQIYLQADYGMMSIDNASTRVNTLYPSVGGGYISSGGGKWSYGIELMVPLNGQIRDQLGPLEYWIGFYYNF